MFIDCWFISHRRGGKRRSGTRPRRRTVRGSVVGWRIEEHRGLPQGAARGFVGSVRRLRIAPVRLRALSSVKAREFGCWKGSSGHPAQDTMEGGVRIREGARTPSPATVAAAAKPVTKEQVVEELVEDVGEVLRLPVHADREEDAHHPHPLERNVDHRPVRRRHPSAPGPDDGCPRQTRCPRRRRPGGAPRRAPT